MKNGEGGEKEREVIQEELGGDSRVKDAGSHVSPLRGPP